MEVASNGRRESARLAPSTPWAGSLEVDRGDVVGVLARRHSVRVLNFGDSGCLVEVSSGILPGVLGQLSVTFGGSEFSDDVKVARCQALSGAGSVYHVGVQFLLTSRVHERSLRRALRQGFPLAADGRRGGTSGKEEWPNGQPNGERGAPIPVRRAERCGTGSAARAAR